MKLEIQKLTVGYRDKGHELLALDQIDLSLRPGRITALVGESGSGKTTLGKALMGLLPSNARANGKICLGETEITALGAASMNAMRGSTVAMVFQNGAANLNPVHRLLDQVAEPLVQRLGMLAETAREKARGKMVQMGLNAELAARFPHEISGGQTQRALLAMALIMDPSVLILDEPTAALDAMTGNFIAGILRDLAQRQKTILLITHDLDLAQRLADDIAVLYLGQIMEYLPAHMLFQPRHPYTLALSRAYPGMDAVRDLGGIRGDAFYRLVHHHRREDGALPPHAHVQAPGSVHEEGHAPPDGCLFRPRCTQAVAACLEGHMPLIETHGHRVRCGRGGIAELLLLKGITKSYGPVRALRPTDLSIWSGETCCLVGETGSGKTTLAMIAAGVLKPDLGRRSFDGHCMAAWIKRDHKALASRIGVIYQDPAQAVSHRFNVFEIVAEPLRIQQKRWPGDKIRDRVLKALGDVRLPTGPEFLARYPHELNMGAMQRLCIARALVHGPSLLVADEPTSSLDPSIQAKVLKMLLDLQIEKGLTLLFVTHDIGLARKISDRIGVMLDGRLVEIGPAARVFNRPGHPYTAQLIDSARGIEGPLPGTVPTETTQGSVPICPFLARCWRLTPDCRALALMAQNLDSGRHLAWCHHPLGPESGQTAAGISAGNPKPEER